jgi:hypothetical protein
MESNSSISTLSTMDSNPLYLHHGDSPGSILVTQLLTGDNYYTWSRSMFMALTAKNKLQFINGALPKPHSSDPDFFAWTRCNNMVLSWIINSVSKEIAASVISVDSAETMWNDLREDQEDLESSKLDLESSKFRRLFLLCLKRINR